MSTSTEQVHGPFQRMGGLLMGYFAAECVHAVAGLATAALLESGDSTTEALASATGCHAPSLERVLRILSAFGVFTEIAPNRVELTPVGATLRSDVTETLRDAAVFMLSPPMWASCGALVETLRSGEPGFITLHGTT